MQKVLEADPVEKLFADPVHDGEGDGGTVARGIDIEPKWPPARRRCDDLHDRPADAGRIRIFGHRAG